MYLRDPAMQMTRVHADRPIALREAIMACRNGDVASVRQPLLERIQAGDIDPTFVITPRMKLEDAARGYDIFNEKHDHCEQVVLAA